MKRRAHATLAAVLAGLGMAYGVVLPVASETEPEVIVEAQGLRPAILETVVEQRVKFVNRSGRPVHVEFNPAPTRHQVFQVPGEIWATFHVPGRHPYVVHLEGPGKRVVAYQGVVVVRDDRVAPGVPVCNGATISSDQGEVCVER